MGRLDDRVILITGAAAGIGLATARKCVAEGAQVGLVDFDQDLLEKAAAEFGPRGHCIVADVGDQSAAESYTHEVRQRFGRIDAALLNAGIAGKIGLLEDIGIDDFDRVMDVNVRGVWLGLRALFPLMKAAGSGSIVITASVGGFRGAPHAAPYVASKHAVIGLAKTAAIEGARYGIRVNAVAPAPVDTAMMGAIAAQLNEADPGAALRRSVANVPMRRMATATEIANVVTFLLGDEASYCTGTVFPIDGGLSAGF